MGQSENEYIAQTLTREELLGALAVQVATTQSRQSGMYRLLVKLLEDAETILDKSGYGRISYVLEAGQLAASECLVSERHK